MPDKRNGNSNVLLFATAVFPPARVPEADHSLHQCLQLARRGYEVHVLTTKRDSVAAPSPLKVHPIIENWSWGEAMKVWRLVRDIRPSVSILFFLGTLFDYRTMVTLFPVLVKLASPGARVFVQFSNFGSGGSASGSLLNRLRRFAFRHLGRFRYGSLLVASDGTIVLGEQHVDRLERIHPALASRVHLIPPSPILPMASDPGAARARGRKRLGIQDDEFLISFFGRMYPGKGIEPLVEAVKRILPRFPSVRLGLIGGYLNPELYWNTSTSYPEELNRFIRQRGLGDVIKWSGEYRWDSQEASEYLYGSDLVVLPLSCGVHLSNSSFAIVCAHGLPSVTTVGTASESPIRDRDHTYIIQQPTVDQIEEAILDILEDEELRKRLGQGAYRLAGQWFAWDGAMDRMERLFSTGASEPSAETASVLRKSG